MPLQTDFSNRVVLVTGAAQGIGAAIARAFTASGATVHIADIDGDGLTRVARDIGATGHVTDLAMRQPCTELAGTIAAANGRLDILVHAAGGVRGQTGRPLEEVSERDWKDIFAANVDSAFWLAQAVAPLMKKHGQGRIISISSGAGLKPSLTGIQAYTAAKHALVGLTRQLSAELCAHGITVNSVAPGLVLSNPTTRRQWESYAGDRQQQILASTHARRLGEPEDIAAAVLYFASDAAGWVSGQVLSVDGGRF